MAKEADRQGHRLGEQNDSVPEAEAPEELDPEFETALTAALALEPTERIERLGQLAQGLKEELDSSR